ncbi:hypothetical protein [Thiomicrorhabdus indica]|uniref:c-type cytochrome n=1 Tax=Thiomicrorhabdus indica TaxID=2267253 RepID=UPI002AA66A7C|nr:hypothetical protein [Thiomicrorhabdus indica]
MARLIRHSKISKKSVLLSAIPVVVLMAGCGGGGGDSTVDSAPTTTTTQTVAVTGTVPGTIIQAYCSNGSNPSVSSVLNGTDQHPFTLNVPVGIDCRIAMITNEGTVNQVITNLTFNGNPVINLQQPLDLAYIPLPMSPDEAVDLNNDGFADMDISVASEGVSYANTLNYTPVNGRLLASQCFQCHGTNGRSVNGWDSILGESYSEILEELNEYPVTHIMGAQAVGYTVAERQALAAYLSGISGSDSDYEYDERDDESEYDQDDDLEEDDYDDDDGYDHDEDDDHDDDESDD